MASSGKFSAALSLKMWTAWIPLRKCGILSSSGSCPCLEKFSLGLNRNKTANSEESTEIQKGPMSLLERCEKISHTFTPKVCFLTKTVPLQPFSMGEKNNVKLRRKIKFKVIPVYLGKITKAWSILSLYIPHGERLAEFQGLAEFYLHFSLLKDSHYWNYESHSVWVNSNGNMRLGMESLISNLQKSIFIFKSRFLNQTDIETRCKKNTEMSVF